MLRSLTGSSPSDSPGRCSRVVHDRLSRAKPAKHLIDPSSRARPETAGLVDGLPFELIQQHEVVQCPIVDGMSLNVRECGSAILIRERRDEGREILRRPFSRSVLVFFCRFCGRLLLDRLLVRERGTRLSGGQLRPQVVVLLGEPGELRLDLVEELVDLAHVVALAQAHGSKALVAHVLRRQRHDLTHSLVVTEVLSVEQ